MDRRTLVIDIGGGSTELVVGATARASTSARCGSPSASSTPIRRRRRSSGGPLPRCAHLPRCSVDHAIGVAGTITSVAALDLGLEEYDRERVDGHVLPRDGARRQLERLAALPLAERRRLPALDPERAPVIVGGALILVEVLERYGLDAVDVSERDILDGAALEAAALPEPVEGDAPPGAYTCC